MSSLKKVQDERSSFQAEADNLKKLNESLRTEVDSLRTETDPLRAAAEEMRAETEHLRASLEAKSLRLEVALKDSYELGRLQSKYAELEKQYADLEALTGGLTGWSQKEKEIFDHGWNAAETSYADQVNQAKGVFYIKGYVAGHKDAGGPPVTPDAVPLPEKLKAAVEARRAMVAADAKAAEEARRKAAADMAADVPADGSGGGGDNVEQID
jgi:DNA repair exonuclease SbcCD ATPase subunit